MTHSIQWLSFPRIVYVELSDDLQIEDLERFSNDVIKYLNEGEAPVHLIVSDTKVGKPLFS